MQETQVWSLGWEDHLEKCTATHSSIYTWEILWIEGPGGLLSIASQRVKCDWSDFAHMQGHWKLKANNLGGREYIYSVPLNILEMSLKGNI